MALHDDTRSNSSSGSVYNSFTTMSEISSDNIIRPSNQMYESPHCAGCCKVLYDRWLLKVGEQIFHMSCLRCCTCLRTLDTHTSCYVKNDEVFCRYHYHSRFGPKCMACSEMLSPTDWVRRESGFIYHVDCFCCRSCKRKLSTGDTYIIRNSGIPFCPEHYETSPVTDDDNVSVSSVDSDVYGSESSEEKSHPGKRCKRTTFTQQQIMILQNAFTRNPSPGAEELEHIAEAVNHTKRAVVIWFQNCRARHKKRLLSEGIASSSRSKMTENCHWIANPCSPDTIPFME